MMSNRLWATAKRSAARRQIRALLYADEYRCHWCRAPLFTRDDVPFTVTVEGDYYVWEDEVGHRWRGLFATIDHLVPLHQYRNGTTGPRRHRPRPNDPTNLVASCRPCNRARALGAVPAASRPCLRCRRPARGMLCPSCTAAAQAPEKSSAGPPQVLTYVARTANV